MRHAVYSRDLGRSRSWRKATVQSLAQALLIHERIQTTLARAKEAQRLAERLITLGKSGSLSARRRAVSLLRDPEVVDRLFRDVAPRFANRAGGYTRIFHGGYRPGDGASLAVLELVELHKTLEMLPKKKAQKEKEPKKPLPKVKTAPEKLAPKEEPQAPKAELEKTSQKPKKEKEPEKPKGFLEGLRGFFKGRNKQQ